MSRDTAKASKALAAYPTCLNPNPQRGNVASSPLRRLQRGAAGNRPFNFRGLLPPSGKAMTNEAIEGDEWGTYVRLDTFSITRTRDCLKGASPTATESSSSQRWGEPITGRRGTGSLITRTSRYARCETPTQFWESADRVTMSSIRDDYRDASLRHRLLESCL